MLCEKVVLRNFTNFTRKHPRHGLFFNKEKETLAQACSCEFCEVSKNTFSGRTPPVAASKSIGQNAEGGDL